MKDRQRSHAGIACRPVPPLDDRPEAGAGAAAFGEAERRRRGEVGSPGVEAGGDALRRRKRLKEEFMSDMVTGVGRLLMKSGRTGLGEAASDEADWNDGLSGRAANGWGGVSYRWMREPAQVRDKTD